MPSLITIESLPRSNDPGYYSESPALLPNNPLDCLRSEVAPQRLYGDLHEVGFSIDAYDFELSPGGSWSQDFRSDCLELCLNLAGQGVIRCGDQTVEMTPSSAAIYAPGRNELRASRTQAGRHRFIVVCFSSTFLSKHLPTCDCTLDPVVGQFKRPCQPRAGLGALHRLTAEQKQLVSQLAQPQAIEGVRQLLYQGIALQFMAHFFFSNCSGIDLCCPRQKQLAKERVNRVLSILHRDLAEPPALEEIGREVGCSPFHLSRTFSKEVGMTIPQCLRRLRMECAAKLLSSGKRNVTEAAMEVGYSSLSHFSRAFSQTMGCCPAMYSLNYPNNEEPAITEFRSRARFGVEINVPDDKPCCCLQDSDAERFSERRN